MSRACLSQTVSLSHSLTLPVSIPVCSPLSPLPMYAEQEIQFRQYIQQKVSLSLSLSRCFSLDLSLCTCLSLSVSLYLSLSFSRSLSLSLSLFLDLSLCLCPCPCPCLCLCLCLSRLRCSGTISKPGLACYCPPSLLEYTPHCFHSARPLYVVSLSFSLSLQSVRNVMSGMLLAITFWCRAKTFLGKKSASATLNSLDIQKSTRLHQHHEAARS